MAAAIALSGCLKDLLQHGADVDSINREGVSALHLAVDRSGADCHGQSAECVRTLLEYRPDVNAANHQGVTPLLTAVTKHAESVAKLLLEAGAHNHAVDYKGRTCLHHAVHEGYNNMITLLLQHNPDVTAKDRQVCFSGTNSNSMAVFYCHISMTPSLLLVL